MNLILNRLFKLSFYQRNIIFNKIRLSIKISIFFFLKINDFDFDTSFFKKFSLIINTFTFYFINIDFEFISKFIKIIRLSLFLNFTNLYLLNN